MSLYKIAGMYVEMNPAYHKTKVQSNAYLTKDYVKPDLIIDSSIEKNILELHNTSNLSLEDCEYILYGIRFYSELLNHNGFLLHASCVIVDGFAYMFSAPSGTGKSTHTNLYLEYFKDKAKILNDDKPAIIFKDNHIYACGTPFSGKTDLNLNEEYPIKGICFIERSIENYIKPMSFKDAIFNILNQTYRPDNFKMDKLLEFIEKVVLNIPIYTLGCNISIDAVKLSYNTMKQKA